MQQLNEYEQQLHQQQTNYSYIMNEIADAKKYLNSKVQVLKTDEGKQQSQKIVNQTKDVKCENSENSEKQFFDTAYENIEQSSVSSNLTQTQIMITVAAINRMIIAWDSAEKFIQNNYEKQIDSAIKSQSEENFGQTQVNFLQEIKDFVQQIAKNQYNVQSSIQNVENQKKKTIPELQQVENKQLENIDQFIEQIRQLLVYPEFDSNVEYKERIEDLQNRNPIYKKRLFVSIFKKIDKLERYIEKINTSKQNEKLTNKIASTFASDDYTNELKEIICQMEYCKIYLKKYEELSESISSLK